MEYSWFTITKYFTFILFLVLLSTQKLYKIFSLPEFFLFLDRLLLIHPVETNSLQRTMQIVECGLLHQRAQGRVSSEPRTPTVFVKTLYTLSIRVQTHLPKFPETSLNKGKRKIQSKSTCNSYALNLGS